nr:PREDICTED: endogenous retrovirus group K member 25 Pol protein-like [Apteryx mantelli mantelli]
MITVVGATGKTEQRPFLRPLHLNFRGKELDHEFLYVPDCPTSLLGRDLLSRFNAKIIFENGKAKLQIPEEEIARIFIVKEIANTTIPIEVENAVVPWVWETQVPGLAKAAKPVIVELKEGVQPVRVRQYPIQLEARKGVAPLIAKFLMHNVLEECESEYNTPIFPIRKPNGDYRLVQDLRAVNEIVKDIHPVVANPYTLLTSVAEQFRYFSVIDLKDAFFCIPLALQSRKLFAFEWENPDTGRKRQLTWTRLPQGFKNSPTIFGNQLARELEDWKEQGYFQLPSKAYLLLQYVDDIFVATERYENCITVTVA